jgi:hypothetical protein
MCATKCKPPTKVYKCNHTVGECQVSPPGHAGGQAKSICATNCTKPKPKPKPPPMVVCNNVTLKCEKAKNHTSPGAQTAAACAKVCVPKYLCQPNGTTHNLTCNMIKRTDPAYSGAAPLAKCQSTCKVPPKHNCTPPSLQGTYRGILISGDGTPHGEWDLKMGVCHAELRNASGLVWDAAVSTGGLAPLTFTLGKQGPTGLGSTDGNSSLGGVIHAIYTFEHGPQPSDLTTRFSLAMSAINGKIPDNWMDVMTPSSGGRVLGLVKCINDKPRPPVPGGTYCDPTTKPPEMCPPFRGEPASPCPACAHPPCLCPGNYPPPPPGPPGSKFCSFGRVFAPAVASETEARRL